MADLAVLEEEYHTIQGKIAVQRRFIETVELLHLDSLDVEFLNELSKDALVLGLVLLN